MSIRERKRKKERKRQREKEVGGGREREKGEGGRENKRNNVRDVIRRGRMTSPAFWVD